MARGEKFHHVLLGSMLIAAGAGMLLAPAPAAEKNRALLSREIYYYNLALKDESADVYKATVDAALRYNEAVREAGSEKAFSDPDSIPGYESALNPAGTGIMGTITIDAIGVELPIYHGTGEDVLSKGAGHLKGSSLPTGGLGNHSVICAHSGYPGMRLFTDLGRLKAGDVFVLQISGDELVYEIDRVSTVLPTDMQELYIMEGEDYCTLMTCTPLGINTHRLLVRGHRVYPDENQR